MGWSSSADPRKRQFEVKKGENEALKREIMDIENKRVEEHRDLTSDVSSFRAPYVFSHLTKVGLELAPLMKAQPTGNPLKDPSTGYMMDAKLTSTDITKHAAQQTVQPWHSRENKSHYWSQLTGQVGGGASGQTLELIMILRWRRRKVRVKKDGWRTRRHKLNISRSDMK